MKHLLLTTIAAVVLVGCGTSIYEADLGWLRKDPNRRRRAGASPGNDESESA